MRGVAGMLKYLSKFASDILPSVAATIIGAYIVNHYISAKPAPDAPAAAVSLADPKSAGSKPAEPPADVANIPAAGVRAKGISEKAIFDRSTAEKAQEKPQEKPQEKSPEKSAEKSAEKPADKPAETASIPADTRRHSPAPREKTAIRTIPLTAPVTAPAPVQPAVSTVAPAAATPPASTVEAALPPEEHRDANDLARAAIERLRGGNENLPHAQEAARTPDAGPRVIAAPQGQPLAILRPLPPPITVSTPPDEATGPSQTQQPYPTSARIDDPRRPTPPADIPSAQPFDLRAEAEPPVREHRNVAEDMLSAAKSVFHAVLPQ
jgi:hypothetical protein